MPVPESVTKTAGRLTPQTKTHLSRAATAEISPALKCLDSQSVKSESALPDTINVSPLPPIHGFRSTFFHFVRELGSRRLRTYV